MLLRGDIGAVAAAQSVVDADASATAAANSNAASACEASAFSSFITAFPFRRSIYYSFTFAPSRNVSDFATTTTALTGDVLLVTVSSFSSYSTGV